MNIFEKTLVFLDGKMPEPQMYGWFHLMFFILLILAIILVRFKYNNLNNKSIKKILLIYALTCLFLEVYKQMNFAFHYDLVHTWWSYQWYAFPFQFCSTPMYVALVAALTKKEKIEKACYTFLATYGLVAGLAVMLYPSTVFVETIGINIQTMVHHSSMVFIGFFLLINNKIKYDFKSLLSGTFVFIICILIALFFDITSYYMGINNGLEMFFISPFHTSSLPVFNIIYDNVNYFIFLLIYILSFTFGAFIILQITKIKNLKLNRFINNISVK
jgi:hypothetical protein